MKKQKEKLNKKLRKNGGFTLVEMLIVVAIIAILVAVSIPMFSTSLTEAKNATDDANMRAAKAAASVEYYNNEGSLGSNVYYNATSGVMQDSPPSGYNKNFGTGAADGLSSAAAENTYFLKASESGGVITVTWANT